MLTDSIQIKYKQWKKQGKRGHDQFFDSSNSLFLKKNRKCILSSSIVNSKLPTVNLVTFRNAGLIQVAEGKFAEKT
jgi:hypothetical protein